MILNLLLVPTALGVGLTSASLGLIRAFDRLGQPVAFVRPIEQFHEGRRGSQSSQRLVELTTDLRVPPPIELQSVINSIASGQEQTLLENVVAKVSEARALVKEGGLDTIVIVEGLAPTSTVPFAEQLNAAMGEALDAATVLVGMASPHGPVETTQEFALAARPHGERVVGCLLNQVREEDEQQPVFSKRLLAEAAPPGQGFAQVVFPYRQAFQAAGLNLVGAVPRRQELSALRISDVAKALGAKVVHPGDQDRRVLSVSLAAKAVPAVFQAFRPGTLVIVPGDRSEVLMAAALAVLRGVPIAGLLLTGQVPPDPQVVDLCRRAMETGLPILASPEDTLETVDQVLRIEKSVRADDRRRAELVMNTIANAVDEDWLRQITRSQRPRRLSPPAFRHLLIMRAKEINARIVLPEGDEARTIAAAVACVERGIARCVLLGDASRIRNVAADHGIVLTSGVEIIDPSGQVDKYVRQMMDLRKHKGLTEQAARNQLQDRVVLGTMMLEQGVVDGLVSGAVHTTADIVRPALQLVKTAEGASIVSSVFFMCLPEQVLVYGDCAINPDPSAEELAEIALQSAESAAAFGIEPVVAMISYSTGSSGAGQDVEKVAEATRIAKLRRPDLTIDGPLQYDAAVMPDVAASKAPGSVVAGRATVLVFPDLNTGNTTYKAVQRSAHVVSIGPMLQGLARPINDLSRGCLVEDIIYTIALTAIQSSQGPEREETRDTLFSAISSVT